MGAAAASVLLGLAFHRWPGEPPEAVRTHHIPSGRPVSGRGESFSPARGAPPEAVQLPDGSRFRVQPASIAAFRAPGPGERIVVDFRRGALEAEVAKGAGVVRILSEPGEVRVLGTAFLARAFRVHLPDAVSVLSVEVSEGVVELSAPGRKLRVPAGHRGILWKSARDPAPRAIQQEVQPADWRAVAALGRDWERWGDPPGAPNLMPEPVFLLAASWQGIGDWGDVLDGAGETPAHRRIAAALLGLCAEAEDGAWLLSRFDREPDAGIRKPLLPHLARVLRAQGEGGCLDFLGRVSREDPSEEIRREAEKLMEGYRE